MTVPRKVGLLGGTFDPPHIGHLVVAECARVALALDEVRLLVTGQPWMKDSVTEAHHRVEMTRCAVGDDPHLRVDDREVRRGGPTYTVDTLRELVDQEPGTEWWFLLGEDAAASLPQWRESAEVSRLAKVVVVTRPGHDPVAVGDGSLQVKQLEVPALEVSSTNLRRRYRGGDATRYLVPPAVDRYIRNERLYGA